MSTAPAWNDTFAAGDYLYSDTVIHMFYAALQERQWAAGIDDRLSATNFSTMAQVPPSGDPAARVDDALATPPDTARSPASAREWGGLGYLQVWLEIYCVLFVDPDFNPVGSGAVDRPDVGSPIWNYTLDTWRTKAGFADGFRRRKPREILTTADATDLDDNDAEEGQIAYGPRYDGILTGVPGQEVTGCLWRYDGSVWQPAGPNVRPDVLDSSSGAPSFCEPDIMQSGDYVGPWLFNQIRDGFNALVVMPDNGFSVADPVGGGSAGNDGLAALSSGIPAPVAGEYSQATWIDDSTAPISAPGGEDFFYFAEDWDGGFGQIGALENSYQSKTGAGASTVSWAAAQSAAETSYGAATVDVQHNEGDFSLQQYTSGDRSGTDRGAEIEGVQARLVLHGVSARLSCKIQWWGYITAPDVGDVNGFNAGGLPGTITQNEWNKLAEWTHTGSLTADHFWTEWETASGVVVGSVSSVPAWVASPPNNSTVHTLGWCIANRGAIIDYRVSGGFQYTVDT